jgi:hypothetical protein
VGHLRRLSQSSADRCPAAARAQRRRVLRLLAHEIAHLGGGARHFARGIYQSAQNLEPAACRSSREPANAFDRALAFYHRWYAPWFYAYSFASRAITSTSPIASRQRHQRTDARPRVDPGGDGDALPRGHLLGALPRRVEEAPEPPYKPYSLLPRAFKIMEKEPLRQQWLAEALRRYAAENDTHPSLAERLAALEVSPQVPPPATTSAALMTLGPAAQPAIDHCDDVWRKQNLANWRKRHNEIREARWKLAEYEQHEQRRARTGGPVVAGGLLLSVHREEDAIDCLQQLVARKGSFPDATCCWPSCC